MSRHRLAMLGFGNVGKALARLLLEKENELMETYGISYSVIGIATGRHGVAIDPNGIDLRRAIELDDMSVLCAEPTRMDSFDFIRHCGADVLFENSPVNYQTGQPAVDHLRTALEMGMHALTANKGPVVHAYRELTALAQSRGRKFYFESTVMDGAPIFSLFRETLPGARLLSFNGVLNSTTNLILTRMEEGESFEKAVEYCQQIGISETEPGGDIDGWDACVKVAVLVTVLMGVPLKPVQIDRTGIREITTAAIEHARSQGKRWKLVCTARRIGEFVEAKVTPELISRESPLYGVDGTTSVVQFETDVLGLLSVVESNPGPQTTAYGLLADFINAVKR